jgi:hypothetical protein
LPTGRTRPAELFHSVRAELRIKPAAASDRIPQCAVLCGRGRRQAANKLTGVGMNDPNQSVAELGRDCGSPVPAQSTRPSADTASRELSVKAASASSISPTTISCSVRCHQGAASQAGESARGYCGLSNRSPHRRQSRSSEHRARARCCQHRGLSVLRRLEINRGHRAVLHCQTT